MCKDCSTLREICCITKVRIAKQIILSQVALYVTSYEVIILSRSRLQTRVKMYWIKFNDIKLMHFIIWVFLYRVSTSRNTSKTGITGTILFAFLTSILALISPIIFAVIWSQGHILLLIWKCSVCLKNKMGRKRLCKTPWKHTKALCCIKINAIMLKLGQWAW